MRRQRDRGAHTRSHELHETVHDPFIGVDPGAGQHLTAIARARPAGDLLGTIAVFLVVGDCVVQRGQDDRREQFARTLALLVIIGRGVHGVEHVTVLILALAFSCVRLFTDNRSRFATDLLHARHAFGACLGGAVCPRAPACVVGLRKI